MSLALNAQSYRRKKDKMKIIDKHLFMLKRRLVFIERKLAERDASDNAIHYLIPEVRAMQFAVELIETMKAAGKFDD